MADTIVINELETTSVIFVSGDQGPQGPPGSIIPVNLVGDITGSGFPGTELETTLTDSGVIAGTYGYHAGVPSIVVDSKGRITSAETVTITIPTSAITEGILDPARLPAFTGDITTVEGDSVTTLKDSGIEAGTYTIITFNSKGIAISGGKPEEIGNLGITNVYTKTETEDAISTALSSNISFTTLTNIPTTLNGYGITDAVNTSALGDTIPTLVHSLIPAQFLPSYVDDVLEFTNLAAFPDTGETGKIYVSIETGYSYRWSGTTYIEIGGKATTDASLLTSGTLDSARLPIATSSSLGAIKLGNGLSIDAAGIVTVTVAKTTDASELTTGTLNAARLPSFSGGEVTSNQGSEVLNLVDSGVTAGDYTLANITVDAKGRITAASSGSNASAIQSYVKNTTGVTILKGTPVYISGATGANVLIDTASNASEATSSKTLGLLAADIATGSFGYVITEGVLSGLNTGTAQEGDPVWLGTDGTLIYGLTNKPVAPAHLVYLGVVTRAQSNNGVIYVKVQNGFELNELHNILFTNLADNDVLSYDNTLELWVNKQVSGVGGGTQTTDAGDLTSGTLDDARLSANVVFTNDTRLSDARTPTAHNQDISTITVPTNTAIALLTNGKLADGALSSKVVLLDGNNKIDTAVLPSLTTNNVFVIDAVSGTKNDIITTSSITSVAGIGDICIVNAESKTYILKATPATTLGNWIELASPSGSVSSVNGKIGTVSLKASDLATGGYLATGSLPAFTGGDVTSTAGSASLALANTGVTAASYTFTNLTVDSKGRITAASSGSLPIASITDLGAIKPNGTSTVVDSTTGVLSITRLIRLKFLGNLSVQLGSDRWYPEKTIKITSAYMSFAIAGEGGTVITVKKNGLDFFTIAASAGQYKTTALTGLTYQVLPTDFLSADITASSGGKNLTITLGYE